MNKQEITNVISADKTFNKILSIYKNNEKTDGQKYEFSDDSRNGLTNSIYVISIGKDINTIIVPIFSSEKTITWNFGYLSIIKDLVPELNELEDHEIMSKIKCPLYYLDNVDNELLYLSYVSASNWLQYGNKGRNGNSVYWWNDKLPNKSNITKKQIISDVFVETLPYLTKTEIKNICKEYATKYYEQYAGTTRSAKQKINNISNGLYAEITIYLDLLKSGYDVEFNWLTEDDLGIDIMFNVGGETLHIDVKSTKDKFLKISKHRKETDFYAICTWDNTKPVLLGFLHKYYFWKSNIMKTDGPTKKGEMFVKEINDVLGNMCTINEIYGQFTQYKKKKIKQNERLFENA